jgi:hypothetical protein
MSSLVQHARHELEACGQFAEDPAYAQSIVASVAAFASYGHSGGSASVAIEQLTALLSFQNLSPLTDNPNEWCDVGEQSGYPLWQNRRNGTAFSTDSGKNYYLLDERDRLGVSNDDARRHRSAPGKPETTAVSPLNLSLAERADLAAKAAKDALRSRLINIWGFDPEEADHIMTERSESQIDAQFLGQLIAQRDARTTDKQPAIDAGEPEPGLTA